MYDALKITFDRVLYSYEMQIFDFVVYKEKSFFGELGISTRKLFISNKNILKLKENRPRTDRERKKTKNLVLAHNQNIYQFLAEVNMAHQHLQFFCNILYLSENNLKYIEDMASISNGLYENNFTALVKTLDSLDGTDRESLILFNKLRNLLCHTSIEQAKIYLNGEVLVDIIDISSYIQHFLSLVTNFNKNKFKELIEINVERYGGDNMKNSLKGEGFVL